MKSLLIPVFCIPLLFAACGKKSGKKAPPSPPPPAMEEHGQPDTRPDPHNVRKDIQTELQRRDEQLQKRMDEIDPR